MCWVRCRWWPAGWWPAVRGEDASPDSHDGAGQGPAVPEQDGRGARGPGAQEHGVEDLTGFLEDHAGLIFAASTFGMAAVLSQLADSFTTASGDLTTFGVVLSWIALGIAVVGAVVTLWIAGAGVAAAVGRFRLRRRFARQLAGEFPDWR